MKQKTKFSDEQFLSTAEKIPYACKSSFAFDHAKKRSIQYLRNEDMEQQIPHIPDRYPSQPGLLTALDIAVRAKILKAYLEDAFATNRFTVKITRKKSSSVIKITHDSLEPDKVTEIAMMYTDSTTKLLVAKSQGIT